MCIARWVCWKCWIILEDNNSQRKGILCPLSILLFSFGELLRILHASKACSCSLVFSQLWSRNIVSSTRGKKGIIYCRGSVAFCNVHVNLNQNLSCTGPENACWKLSPQAYAGRLLLIEQALCEHFEEEAKKNSYL